MLHKGKPRIFDASRSASNSRTSSTFTTNSSGNPHSTKKAKLHSKSTYFYNDDSSSGDASSSSLAAFQRHPVGLCLLRVNCKSQGSSSRNAHPAQPGNDVLWKDCRRKNLGKASRLTYLVPSACVLALLIGGIVSVSPILNDGNQAYAVTDNTTLDNPAGCSTDSSNTAACIKLIVAPNKDDSTNSSITVGEPAYFSSIITVGGNHISNYSLTLNTASGSNGNLVGETNSYATVGKVGSNTSPANFPDNTWGYAISAVNTAPDKASLSYNPVPGAESNNSAFLDYQKNLSGTVNNTYKLIFAAKLGNTMPSDKYTTDVYVSAVASATETVENWFRNAGITTMQQMNSTLCKSAPENATSQLRDERDGKLYWVTKLKDENCWMTQNLDYDGGGRFYQPSEWTTSGNAANVTITTAAYYDPGDYVYNVNTENCNSRNFINCVGDDKPFSSVEAGSNLHYHIGNYYSWDAATMGSKSDVSGGSSYDVASNALSSICPSGWQLPTSNNTGSKSFGGLMQAYGITGSTLTTGDGTLYDKPLYFAYGGYLGNGLLNDASLSGYYWSSTPAPNTNTYYLKFTTSSVYPSHINNRCFGYSVRCVAISKASAPTSFTLTYEANLKGHTSPDPQSCIVNNGQCTIKITNEEPPLNSGPVMIFAGWSTDQNATAAEYAPGSDITLTSDVVLYGVWQ